MWSASRLEESEFNVNDTDIIFLLSSFLNILMDVFTKKIQQGRKATHWSVVYCMVLRKTNILLGAKLWAFWESSLHHLCCGWLSKWHVLTKTFTTNSWLTFWTLVILMNVHSSDSLMMLVILIICWKGWWIPPITESESKFYAYFAQMCKPVMHVLKTYMEKAVYACHENVTRTWWISEQVPLVSIRHPRGCLDYDITFFFTDQMILLQ